MQSETEAAADTFQGVCLARLRVLRDSAWMATNIGSACCVAEDGVYEESRQCLETSYRYLSYI